MPFRFYSFLSLLRIYLILRMPLGGGGVFVPHLALKLHFRKSQVMFDHLSILVKALAAIEIVLNWRVDDVTKEKRV